jgi:CRP/FNR family transcriptional regulator, polysaccharide utilization system transcription regulator
MEDEKIMTHCGDCLTKLPIFTSLNEEQFELVNHARCRVRFRPGETIFKQGTVMTHILIVNEGLVKVYLEGIGNHNLILRFARPVTVIGGPGFLNDFKNHITTMAIEETSACFIDVNILTELIKQNKDFALDLLKWVNTQTAVNYMKFIELTQKGMHGRIAGALLYLYNDIFNPRNQNIRINRQDLADLTAMTKESSIRILKDFKDEGTITVEGNMIIINDINRLSAINMRG